MLNAIKQAEEEAREAVEAAKREADALIKEARLDAAVRIAGATDAMRTLKEAAAARGTEAGEKEARALIEKAQKDIEAERKAYDPRVKAAAQLVAKKIIETL